ncbi:hypothetical protein ONZ45_g17935 [Pleurotus djamor]|nr:hypothetical protein ONZ45_g17935 [Pleurotus djamor]
MSDMLEKVLAPLLVGNWVNSFLYMWEILQVISYFKHYNDPLPLKLVVTSAFIVDCCSTINSFIMVYLYTVTNWGKIAYLIITHWPLPVHILTVSITTSIVQAFLIYRYFGISKRWWTTAILVVLLLASITGGIGTTIGLFDFVPFGISNLADWAIKLWLTATSACGILVAIGLVYELSRVRTAFKSTRTLVRRLVFNSIQAGNVGIGIALCAGRIYSLTMLWNLNMRKRNNQGSSTGRAAGAPGDLSDSLQLTGIQIHRTAIVHIDEHKTSDAKSFDDSNASPKPRDVEQLDDEPEKKESNYQVPQLESRITFPQS